MCLWARYRVQSEGAANPTTSMSHPWGTGFDGGKAMVLLAGAGFHACMRQRSKVLARSVIRALWQLVFGLYWYCYCYSIRFDGPSVMGLFSGYSPLTSEVCSCFASDLYCTDPASGKQGNMLMHKYQTMRLPYPFANWQVMLACCRASSKTELPARQITVPQQWPLLASQ